MNAPHAPQPQVEAFFFDCEPGTRLTLYHAPDPRQPIRGAILYVHPFAEEMHRSRRMAALQARAFAEMGYGVLQLDLFGCGDSCGDFSAARWEIWKRDLAVTRAWLAARCPGPTWLWGLRLGALLALDYASTAPVDGLLLWQPVLHGRAAINQFLRAEALRPAETPPSTDTLREHLLMHGQVDANGYTLPAELANAVDAVDAFELAMPACMVHWLAAAGPAPDKLRASADSLARRWSGGAALRLHLLYGAVPFWANAATPECPAMLTATRAAFEDEPP